MTFILLANTGHLSIIWFVFGAVTSRPLAKEAAHLSWSFWGLGPYAVSCIPTTLQTFRLHLSIDIGIVLQPSVNLNSIDRRFHRHRPSWGITLLPATTPLSSRRYLSMFYYRRRSLRSSCYSCLRLFVCNSHSHLAWIPNRYWLLLQRYYN